MAKSTDDKTRIMPVGTVERVIIVGCGGTGSILAEHICRMIKGYQLDTKIMLADGDTVEQANITRQNFAPHEIGAYKAEALALRLSGQFGMEVQAHPQYVGSADLQYGMRGNELLISCTDTLISRKQIAQGMCERTLWLDAGNELHHGQAVIGTTRKKLALQAVYRDYDKKPFVADLPNIAAVNPGVMRARRTASKAGCAAQPFALQGFGVNAMSALAAATIAKQVLVDKKVSMAAIYFNVSEGRMISRDITKDLFKQWR